MGRDVAVYICQRWELEKEVPSYNRWMQGIMGREKVKKVMVDKEAASKKEQEVCGGLEIITCTGQLVGNSMSTIIIPWAGNFPFQEI